MANIFQISNERVRDINRNTYDLSFQNNLTMKFGALYPVMLAEVLPGDTWKIKPTFALEFLPLVFPVQTRMKANLHAFYVRRRTLWKDFMDFMGDNGENVPPYLDFNANFEEYTQTGHLGDYMGLPTTLVGRYGANISLTPLTLLGTSIVDITGPDGAITPSPFADAKTLVNTFNFPTFREFFSLYVESDATKAYDGQHLACLRYTSESDKSFTPSSIAKDGFYIKVIFTQISPSLDIKMFSDLYRTFGVCVRATQTADDSVAAVQNAFIADSLPRGVQITYDTEGSDKKFNASIYFGPDSFIVQKIANEFSSEKEVTMQLDFCIGNGSIISSSPDESYSNPGKKTYLNGETKQINFVPLVELYLGTGTKVQNITREINPYYDSSSSNKDKQLKISAEPFRAYEAIYNAFYRDVRNNPFILNGKIEYNKYIPTDEGGADTTPYKLHFRNWEKDFLTTAVQSPQQGVAPLVGITNYVNNLSSDVTFTSEDGTSYKARLETTDDGQMIKSVKVDSSDIPSENLRALVDYAQSGISINDFRNVNAFQIWLETNMRHGQRFKDLIKGHYNVDVRYDELQMPEFLGGVSEDVRVNMVTQTSSDTEDSPLGSYAGQATCVGTSRSTITRYCDEPGYIMCILSVTPVPNYSQLLPKHFVKRDVLDIFTPEFGHIGFQPVRYNEVCPVQAFNDNPDTLNDTFGYQRAWYDYLARVDEVHGLFRTELRNYLITRVFDVKPQLSESFLLVDPAVTNQVFANTTENDDKILGQIYFDVKVKRPIPLYGIPRLE